MKIPILISNVKVEVCCDRFGTPRCAELQAMCNGNMIVLDKIGLFDMDGRLVNLDEWADEILKMMREEAEEYALKPAAI